MSSTLDWAKREVEIACKKENPNRKEGEFDYGCACYESALKAFESLCEDCHSGFSIKITKAILDRLLNEQPLTPIEDTDDVWEKCIVPKNSPEMYKCKRMHSLYKTIHADGTVKYNDINSSYCVDINDPDCTYYSGLVKGIINEMFPITMPYMPGKQIAVYCEEFLTTKKNGDFDTVGVFYALKTVDGKQAKIEINRFFRMSEDNTDTGWIEISKEEYYKLKERRLYR